MTKPVRWLTGLLLGLIYQTALAQSITTQALTTNAVCAGTTLDVPFTLSGLALTNNTFTVQLADGSGSFANLATSAVTQNGDRYLVTATLPANAAYSSGYRVRVVSSSPAVQGSASPTTLTIKTTPGAPAIALQLVSPNTYRYTLCQNDQSITLADYTGPVPDNYRVQYDVGTNPAPTAQQTFTAPVISASVASNAVTYNLRFVVTDAARGCNPSSAAVAYIQTEVKQRPGAPAVANSAVTYCLNGPAQALSATRTIADTRLIWYDAADNVLSEDMAPTPSTSQVGVKVYQVAQAIEQCQGPRTRLTVSVETTPVPTVSQSRLEYCRGTAAPQLAATGSNLRWTTPTGATSTTPPNPSTGEVSKTTNGDTYYVTQTGANGCVSAPAAIQVYVQGPPTLALAGNATIVQGQNATLSLTFTGNGPYRYKLSDGSAGTAQKDTTIRVSPASTTVYQVTEVSNKCGTGIAAGSATITIQAASVTTLPLAQSLVCAGSTLTVNFQTTGTGNIFRLRVAPVAGGNVSGSYADLSNQVVGQGQVSGTLPTTLTAGTYAVLVAPITATSVTTTPTFITVRAPASATLTATPTTIVAGSLVRLSVAFSGDGPWMFSYRDSTNTAGTPVTVSTNANPHLLELSPQRTTTYRIVALNNNCGNTGTLPAPVQVTVSALLATETIGSFVEVYPIPARTGLTVRLAKLPTEPASLELIDLAGRATYHQITQQTLTTISLHQQAPGTYLLRVRVGDQTTTRRVLVE